VAEDSRNLPEALRAAAKHHPDRGIALYDGRGRSHERRTYPEVLASLERAAARYQTLGVRPGDRVLVCLPTCWEWLEAWLGALMLGAIPGAVAPVGALGSSDGHGAGVEGILTRIGARTLVAGPTIREELAQAGARRSLEALITPEALAEVAPASRPAAADPAPDEVAFVQFTSGSTGVPRAVMIPHRSVIHNNIASNEAIGSSYGSPADRWADSMVSWLPMHHDMGLVGCLFLSINFGLDLWLFPPTTFLARPKLWLDCLARQALTFTPAPNFGYQLCVERVKQADIAGLDLSGWRSAMTGAEMVRPETVRGFVELTEGSGFRPESICPCYGLAEGTLAVTFDLQGRGIRTLPRPEGMELGWDLAEVVSVGEPVRDTELRIAAPDGSALAPGEIGEVRARGPGIFAGYYNDPEATAESLQDGWLCTGDLGFVSDGELYLTGRLKDVLIIRGNNVMPHELEWLAESVAGGGGSQRCGAFSVARSEEGEQAVLVLETTEKDPAVRAEQARDIRIRVGRAMSLPLADVMFVRRGRIPKTTSGKVQRKELRERYLDGSLERLDD